MIRSAVLPSVLILFGSTVACPAQVKLEFKYREGSTSTVQSTTKTHQILRIEEVDLETSSEQVITMTTTVGKRMPEGTLLTRSKVDSLWAQASLPGGVSLEFDSSNPDVKSDNPQLQIILELFRAASALSFTTVLSKDNEVIAVEPNREVLDTVSDTAAEFLKSQFDAERLKRIVIQQMNRLYDQPVEEGLSWDRTEVLDIAAGQTFTFQTRYRYLGTVQQGGKTLDKIGVTSTDVSYEQAPDSPARLKVTDSDLKIESSKGAILFDRNRGEVVESNNVTRITGSMTFSTGGNELPGKLDLTLDTRSTLQR